MTLDELKVFLQSVESTNHLEVCGHCKRWVLIQQDDLLQEVYPEVYDALILPPAKEDFNQEIETVKTDPTQVETENKPQAFSLKKMIAITLVVLLSTLTCVSFLFLQADKADHEQKVSYGFSTDILDQLISENNQTQFVALVEEAISDDSTITEKLEYLPYLRLYSFYTNGEKEVLSARVIKGEADSAPSECNLTSWTNSFEESFSDWKKLIYDKELPTEHWARILGWDPYWILRREYSGWLLAGGYYGYCIGIAQKSFAQLMQNDAFKNKVIEAYSDEADDMLISIMQRLNWLNHKVLGGEWTPIEVDKPTNNTISMWNCLEAAKDYKYLSRCKGKYDQGEDPWKIHIDQRYIHNFLRLTLENEFVGQKELKELRAINKRFEQVDHFTQFDFSLEKSWVESIIKHKGNLSEAMKISH